MRIHDQPTHHIERALAAVKEERSRSHDRGLSSVPEDTLAITQSSVLLEILRQESTGPEKEARLESLQASYAGGQLQIDMGETSQVLIWRGFHRIRI